VREKTGKRRRSYKKKGSGVGGSLANGKGISTKKRFRKGKGGTVQPPAREGKGGAKPVEKKKIRSSLIEGGKREEKPPVTTVKQSNGRPNLLQQRGE